VTCPRTRAMNEGRQGSILGSGRLNGDSLCKVTGRKAAVSGARGYHFRRRFYRSLYSNCNKTRHENKNALFAVPVILETTRKNNT
jgi:hypothetical protein